MITMRKIVSPWPLGFVEEEAGRKPVSSLFGETTLTRYRYTQTFELKHVPTFFQQNTHPRTKSEVCPRGYLSYSVLVMSRTLGVNLVN